MSGARGIGAFPAIRELMAREVVATKEHRWIAHVLPVKVTGEPGIVQMDRKSRFSIRRFASLEAMKRAEYDYWQQRPAHERLEAVTTISAETYGLGNKQPHASRLQRIIVHLKR